MFERIVIVLHAYGIFKIIWYHFHLLEQEIGTQRQEMIDHLQHLKWQKIIIILKMYFADIKHYTYNNNTM